MTSLNPYYRDILVAPLFNQHILDAMLLEELDNFAEICGVSIIEYQDSMRLGNQSCVFVSLAKDTEPATTERFIEAATRQGNRFGFLLHKQIKNSMTFRFDRSGLFMIQASAFEPYYLVLRVPTEFMGESIDLIDPYIDGRFEAIQQVPTSPWPAQCLLVKVDDGDNTSIDIGALERETKVRLYSTSRHDFDRLAAQGRG